MIVEADFPFRQPYEGVVMDNNDPLGLCRCRIKLPGFWEPYGPWALPVGGRYGGGNQRGMSAAAPLGADVLVFFINGNIENARYLCAHQARGEVASEHAVEQGSGTNRQNKVWQDEHVKIEIDDRNTSKGIRIKDKSTGSDVVVELDLVTKQVGISTTLGISISSVGAVRITAGQLLLNGRLVLPGSKPI